MSPAGFGNNSDCAHEGQSQFTLPIKENSLASAGDETNAMQLLAFVNTKFYRGTGK
jgi:hypothetical protein